MIENILGELKAREGLFQVVFYVVNHQLLIGIFKRRKANFFVKIFKKYKIYLFTN